MKKKLIIGLFFNLTIFSNAQVQNITLADCQYKAEQNYPLIQQYKLLDIATHFTLDNISKVYLPQVSLNAQATYQSEVTKLSLKQELPIAINVNDYIPEMKKDQYRAYVEIQQLIWDGNRSKAQSELVKANNNLEKQKITVSLYDIKNKINELYFGILSVDEQKKQLSIYREDLNSNVIIVKSMLKNGVAMTSDLDQINVEFLNLDQKDIELDAAKETYLNMLSFFIGEKLNKFSNLTIPEDIGAIKNEINRPELDLFKNQKSFYTTQKEAIKAKNLPTLGLFAQGGYGRPALNMLNPDFKFFGIAGLQFNWNFGNLYTRKNELNNVENELQMVDVQEKTFLFNTNLQLEHISPEIKKYQDLIEKDKEIIDLRKRVKLTSQSKYKNGIYQINDLISDINAENLARQAKAQHYIQYLKNTYDYQFTQGN